MEADSHDNQSHTERVTSGYQIIARNVGNRGWLEMKRRDITFLGELLLAIDFG